METDLDKAREIVRKHIRFIGRMGMMHENIAIAVAQGIALGRKEGIAMAAEAVSRLKSENDAQPALNHTGDLVQSEAIRPRFGLAHSAASGMLCGASGTRVAGDSF